MYNPYIFCIINIVNMLLFVLFLSMLLYVIPSTININKNINNNINNNIHNNINNEPVSSHHHHPHSHQHPHHHTTHMLLKHFTSFCAARAANCSFVFTPSIESTTTMIMSKELNELRRLLDEEDDALRRDAKDYKDNNNNNQNNRDYKVVFRCIRWSNATIESLSQVDVIIAARPWWKVEIISLYHSDVMLLLRYIPNYSLNRYLHETSALMFPSADDCHHSPVMISNHNGETWGNRWTVAYEAYLAIDKSIMFYVYVTGGEDNNRVVYFAGVDECVEFKNKWDCLFLTTSNCSVPKVVQECVPPNCAGYGYSGARTMFNKFDFNGEPVLEAKEAEAIDAWTKELDAHNRTKHLVDKNIDTGRFRVYKPQSLPNVISAETSLLLQHSSSAGFLETYYYYLGVVTRLNSLFRMKVQEIMHEFRMSFATPFAPDTPCVALHIRQDDRNKAGVGDMDAYCNKCSLFRPENGQRYEYKQNCEHFTHTEWYDMGCASQLPFGKASLQHFLNASSIVAPEIKNVFIMTDDAEWLHTQAQEYHKKLLETNEVNSFKIYAFPVRPNHRAKALYAAEDFWASVGIAQQCQAFVGHFGSAATHMIFRTLCYFHDNKFVTCPDLYDIANVF